MSIDADRLAAEMVRGAAMLIEKATAPLIAANEALTAQCRALSDRLEQVEARAAVPGPAGRDGLDGKDGAPGKDGVDGLNGKDGIDGKDGAPGRDGVDGKDGLNGDHGKDGIDGQNGAPGRDGIDGVNGRDGTDGAHGKDGAPGRDGIDGLNGKDGEAGPQGERGADGIMRAVDDWQDRVHYSGECVALGGSTWQAVKDTGHAPPHADWRCIAAAGRDGAGFVSRGTYSEEEEYSARDVVMCNGSTFAAHRDSPGPCPGDGWHLWASRGSRGTQGLRGLAGMRGEQGLRGVAGSAPVSLDASDEGIIILTLEDGSQFEADLYPALSKVAR